MNRSIFFDVEDVNDDEYSADVENEAENQEEDDNVNDNESDPLASDRESECDDHEELFGPSVETLLAERRLVPKRRRRAPGSVGLKRRVSEVPAHLNSLMGSATIAYMSQRFDDAEECLARVIEQAPKAVAPYRTLSLIYEEKGDPRKALEYLFVAAELDKQDIDLWKRCAAMCHELSDTERALHCLSMALKASRGRDPEVLRARGYLFFEAGNNRRARDNFVRLAKLCPGDLDAAILVGRVYRNMKHPENAERHLLAALSYVDRHPSRGGDEQYLANSYAQIVQFLVEIQFEKGLYGEAAALLGRLQERRALGDIQVPLAQRVMLAICQYRSGARALASVTFIEFLSSTEVIRENPHLMWHVAEAYFDAGDYAKAIRAYSAIFDLDAFRSNVILHLRRSESFEREGKSEEAIADLKKVLVLRPAHTLARMNLSRLQDFQGRSNAESGKSGSETRTFAPLTHGGSGKCSDSMENRYPGIAQNWGQWAKQGPQHSTEPTSNEASAVAVAKDLLSRASQAYENEGPRQFFKVIETALRAALRIKPETSKYLLDGNIDAAVCPTQDYSDQATLGQVLLLSMDSMKFVGFVEKVFHASIACEGSHCADDVVDHLFALGRSRIKGNPYLRKRLRFLYFMKLLHCGKEDSAFEELRTIAREDPKDNCIWWMLALMDGYMSSRRPRAYPLKIFRFLNRQVKMPKPSTGVLMAASVCAARSLSFTYKSALALLSQVHRRVPLSALCCICMGTNLLFVARSRNMLNRERSIFHAFMYLDKYRRLRRFEYQDFSHRVRLLIDLEIDFNIARAMHDLGLIHLAAPLYHAVLDFEMKDREYRMPSSVADFPCWMDLKRDAAYNLICIYRSCSSLPLAHATMQKYLRF